MEKLLKNIEFEDKSLNVKDDIKQLTSPIILRVKGQCRLSDQRSIEDGSIIVIHGRKNVGILKGKDTNGRNINLFTTCPHTVQLALPDNERKVFKSLEQLCLEEPRPKFVEIVFDDENEVNESVRNGDRLKVLLVEKGGKGPLFMHFRNEKGKHVRLPVDIKASFTACPPDGKEYFISEIANINKAPLALFVQFIQRKSDKNDVFNSLGIVEIIEQTSTDLIFMTVKDNGKLYCCICATPEGLVGQRAKGAVEKTDDHENLLFKISELAPIERFDSIHGEINPLEAEGTLIIQADKIFSKTKLKDKGKRIQSLAVEGDEDCSDKKRNSFMALFKDEKKKDPEKIDKKDKKNKKKNKKNKEEEPHDSVSREESEAEVTNETTLTENSNNEALTVLKREESGDNAEAINIAHEEAKKDATVSQESTNEVKKKKKTADDKKKWKFDFKSKFTGNEKKEKKKKGQHGKANSLDNQRNSAQAKTESISEPCSPGSDTGNDEYEIPDELKAIAAQNKCSEEAHKEKGKSTTLISRTWKKMKKRRRALSASNMQRSYSDATQKKTGDAGDCDDEDSPPPVMDPDYPEEIYEQIPGEFMSQDIYEEAVRAYGAYETAVVPAETSDSGFDELDKKQLDTLREFTVPPPLPGNHPKMQPRPRRGSSLKGDNARISVDSEGFKRFYESMKKSENEIRNWGPEEIEQALDSLQLRHHADKFNESQIDGSLLLDLDEAVLRDLGLSLFEARKLRKFVFGWRPDALRDFLYRQNYRRESKNPSHWSADMVADMITTELGIPELGTFCKENQVNGDLLRDIVIDEELLDYLLTGKASKLNAVKLKNFVLDGWRPPKRKETQYEAVDSQCETSTNESSYEPLSPTTRNASNTYEAPTFWPAKNTGLNASESEMQPASKIENARKAADKKGKFEMSTPLGTTQERSVSREASQEKAKATPTGGSVNSLMQKYEKKSSNIDAPRPFTKAVSPRSPGESGKSPFVANMKKKFNEK